jgi:hypothetical protein
LDAGLSTSTGGEHPNISQAQHRQRRLPVCASRLMRVPVDRDHRFRWKMITQSGAT